MDAVEQMAEIIQDAANDARNDRDFYPDYCSWTMAMAAARAIIAAQSSAQLSHPTAQNERERNETDRSGVTGE